VPIPVNSISAKLHCPRGFFAFAASRLVEQETMPPFVTISAILKRRFVLGQKIKGTGDDVLELKCNLHVLGETFSSMKVNIAKSSLKSETFKHV
jgi:hypothetical protein